MSMPGFTAELSLGLGPGHYRPTAAPLTAAEDVLEPAGPVLWAACMAACCGIAWFFCGPGCCFFCLEACAPALVAPTP